MKKKNKTARESLEEIKDKVGSAIMEKILTPIDEVRSIGSRIVPDPFLPHPNPLEGESLDIQAWTQWDGYSCGAIAGWIVLNSLYPESVWEDFYQDCGPDPEKGMQDGKLLKSLRAFGIGISTKKAPLSFEEIKKAIGKGFPIIALVQRPVNEKKNQAHWVVVYGYHEKKKSKEQVVYLANNSVLGLRLPKSISRGKLTDMPFHEFKKQTKGFNAYICWGKKSSTSKRKSDFQQQRPS